MLSSGHFGPEIKVVNDAEIEEIYCACCSNCVVCLGRTKLCKRYPSGLIYNCASATSVRCKCCWIVSCILLHQFLHLSSSAILVMGEANTLLTWVILIETSQNPQAFDGSIAVISEV